MNIPKNQALKVVGSLVGFSILAFLAYKAFFEAPKPRTGHVQSTSIKEAEKVNDIKGLLGKPETFNKEGFHKGCKLYQLREEDLATLGHMTHILQPAILHEIAKRIELCTIGTSTGELTVKESTQDAYHKFCDAIMAYKSVENLRKSMSTIEGIEHKFIISVTRGETYIQDLVLDCGIGYMPDRNTAHFKINRVSDCAGKELFVKQ